MDDFKTMTNFGLFPKSAPHLLWRKLKDLRTSGEVLCPNPTTSFAPSCGVLNQRGETTKKSNWRGDPLVLYDTGRGMWQLPLSTRLLHGKTELDWNVWLRLRNSSKASCSIPLESAMPISYQPEPRGKVRTDNTTMNTITFQSSSPAFSETLPSGCQALTNQTISCFSNSRTSRKGLERDMGRVSPL